MKVQLTADNNIAGREKMTRQAEAVGGSPPWATWRSILCAWKSTSTTITARRAGAIATSLLEKRTLPGQYESGYTRANPGASTFSNTLSPGRP